LALAGSGVVAQYRPPSNEVRRPVVSAQSKSKRTKPAVRPNSLGPDEMDVQAVTQIWEGDWSHLRGNAKIETADFLLKANEVDYNSQTGDAEARGNVYLKHFAGGEELWADRIEYNLDQQNGRFYNVRGSAPVHIEARPGILTSSNPFYFEGEWAERLEDRYILHNGFVTNCKMPRPWWILQGPKFDVIPGERAVAYRTFFRLRRIPLFYSPFFYKSLERMPRRSGILTPNMGNSSRRGKMIGGGYYWAINRSYDAAYRAQYFTQRGLAHHVDFRGKPKEGTDFNFLLYGVNDRGLLLQDGTRRKEGGAMFSFTGRSDLGHGFYARADANYLTSLTFRQSFTESFNEAIFSEVHSIGYVARDWSTYGFAVVMSRNENFQSTKPDDTIVTRKYPEVEFTSRDRLIWDRGLPIWLSFDSSAGLLRRKQLLFQTRQFLERLDLQPRLMTAFRWKGFSILPSFSIRETRWGESQQLTGSADLPVKIAGADINRSAQEFSVVIRPPSLARVFDSPHWLGDKIKHVIEPELSFRDVSGVNNFNSIVRFDDTELYSNTREAEISITNRLYVKRKNTVEQLMSWQLTQKRFFDPTFGGAVVEGRRNVVLSSLELTPYAFLDGPRNYSPVVSVFRLNPKPGFGVEWRTDYDPLRSKVVNTGLSADAHFSKYFLSIGHNNVRAVPLTPPGTKPFQGGSACAPEFTGQVLLLSPCANQLRGLFGIGNENRRGWNGAFSAIYDFRTSVMQFATTQVTYNTDCCGFSIQYRRFSFGTRNENQFRVAFAVSNIGSFGTLKKQERLF
jgi:LPS-assembly protein